MANPTRTMDREVGRVRRELEAVLKEQLREVERTVRAYEAKRTEGRAERVALARAVGKDLAKVIDDLGGRATAGYERAVDKVLGSTADQLGEYEMPDTLSATSRSALRVQASDTLDSIARIGGEGRATLREIVVAMGRGTYSPSALEEALAGVLGRTAAQTISVVDTAVAAADRAVVLDSTKRAGLKWLLLDGPVDSLARRWCRAHVGKRYTLTKVSRMQNDTGPQPASLYAGGWNCRHRWEPLDDGELGDYPRG